jgi:hypothetical protein
VHEPGVRKRGGPHHVRGGGSSSCGAERRGRKEGAHFMRVSFPPGRYFFESKRRVFRSGR